MLIGKYVTVAVTIFIFQADSRNYVTVTVFIHQELEL